jgi:hypothetical protein
MHDLKLLKSYRLEVQSAACCLSQPDGELLARNLQCGLRAVVG